MKFSDLDLHPLLQKNLEKVKYVECTPIQGEAIPHLLQGRDIAGLAQTGTGKTAAFLVPLIDRVLRGRDRPQNPIPEATEETAVANEATSNETSPSESAAPVAEAGAPAAETHLRYYADWRRRHYILILVPTRELAEQVFENAERLLDGTGLKAISVMGGTTYEKQKAGFKEGVEFVIATPGRLLDLYKENVADLRQVRAVVFDEADRMFDMGFKDDMKFILRRLPRERQFLVFSATLNFEVLNTAYEFGAYPVEINVSKDQPKAEHVTDELLQVGQEEKAKFLLSLLRKKAPRQGIIFSNFKHNVERIARFLTDNGIPAVGISSLLTQAQRNRVMAQFKAENDQNILVATDLAARGLDILGVDLVINFELPDDPENYVHRIGRTGRAGHKGEAVSLVSDRDVDALTRIHEYLGHKVPIGWLEDTDIVKDMKPFPSDRERSRGSHDRGGRDQRRDQRPRRGSERGGGGGRGRTSSSQHPPRHERSQQGRSNGAPNSGGHEPRRAHSGSSHPPRSNGPRREGKSGEQHSTQQNQQRSRPSHHRSGGGPSKPRHAQGQEHRSGQRPRPSSQTKSHASKTTVKTPMPPAKGLSKKVSSFFKKLIGKSK